MSGKDKQAGSGAPTLLDVYEAGHSWLGQRPPGGVDYQQFVMIRR